MGVKRSLPPLCFGEDGDVYVVTREGVAHIASGAIGEAWRTTFKKVVTTTLVKNSVEKKKPLIIWRSDDEDSDDDFDDFSDYSEEEKEEEVSIVYTPVETTLAQPSIVHDKGSKIRCFGAYRKGYFMLDTGYLYVKKGEGVVKKGETDLTKSSVANHEVLLACVDGIQITLMTNTAFLSMTSFKVNEANVIPFIRVRSVVETDDYLEIHPDQVVDMKSYMQDQYAFVMRDGTLIACMHPFDKVKGYGVRVVGERFVSFEISRFVFNGPSFVGILMTANQSFYSVSSRDMAYINHGTGNSPTDAIRGDDPDNPMRWAVPRKLTVLPTGEVKQYGVSMSYLYMYTTTGLYVAGGDEHPYAIIQPGAISSSLDGFVPVVIVADDGVSTRHVKEIDAMSVNEDHLIVMMLGGIYISGTLGVKLSGTVTLIPNTYLCKVADYPLPVVDPDLLSSSLLCTQCVGGEALFRDSAGNRPYCSYYCYAEAAFGPLSKQSV